MQTKNSKEYWDDRFKTNNWEHHLGREQTTLFALTCIDLLPSWFIEDINNQHMSICDFGCAEGDALPILNKTFPTSLLTGIDHSIESIKKATTYYPQFHFKCQDVFSIDQNYDVFYASNVLEHFSDPFSIIESLLSHTNHYFLFLVPFNVHDGCKEHEFNFTNHEFPEQISNFKKVFSNIKTLSTAEYHGLQLLCIYQHKNLSDETLTQ